MWKCESVLGWNGNRCADSVGDFVLLWKNKKKKKKKKSIILLLLWVMCRLNMLWRSKLVLVCWYLFNKPCCKLNGQYMKCFYYLFFHFSQIKRMDVSGKKKYFLNERQPVNWMQKGFPFRFNNRYPILGMKLFTVASSIQRYIISQCAGSID